MTKYHKNKKRPDNEDDAVFAEPRIIFADVEVAPSIGAYFGKPWDTRIIEETNSWYILSFAYKWLGSDEIVVKALPDYPAIYKKSREDDSALVKDLWQILDQCDVLCAHNAKFDVGKIQARCLYLGLQPPSPFVSYDTLSAVRRLFGFSDNRLSSLAKLLKLPAKLDSGGSDTWMAILRGDKKSEKEAWARLKVYNAGDVLTLEALYHRVKAWDDKGPKRSHFTGSEQCDVCGCNQLESRGWRRNKASITRRLRCRSCGHWQLARQKIRLG